MPDPEILGGAFERLTAGIDTSVTAEQFDSLREALSEVAGPSAAAGTLPSPFSMLAHAVIGSGGAVRRVDPAALPVDIGIFSNPWRGLAPSRVIGPIPDRGGGKVRFEVYGPAHSVRFVSGGTVLFAIGAVRFPKKRPVNGKVTLDVQPGSAWIAAALVTLGAPAGFLGVRVVDGKITIPAGSVETNGKVDIGLLPSYTVALQIAPPITPAAAPGACSSSPRTTITAPANLRLEVQSGVVHKIEVGPGMATAYGQTYELGGHTGNGRYEPTISSVVFDAPIAPSSFDSSEIASSLIGCSGTAPITHAGWALPVTEVSADALGEAASSGAWVIAFGTGIVSRIQADDPQLLPLASGWILISPSSFVLKGVAKPVFPVERKLFLWTLAHAAKNLLPLVIRHPVGATVAYACDWESERVLVTGMCQFWVDEPVDVAGHPIAIADGGVLMAVTKQAGAAMITLYGVPGSTIDFVSVGKLTPSDTTVAVRNALLWLSSPILYVLFGQLGVAGQVTSGTALFLFWLRRWAPILPDPYVASFSLLAQREKQSNVAGYVLADLAWSDGGAARIAFLGQLPAPAIVERHSSPPGTRPHPEDPQDVQPPSSPRGTVSDARKLDQFVRPVGTFAFERDINVLGPAAVVGGAGVRLLDVSSSKDLIGVEWSGRPSREFGGTVAAALTILTGMDVRLPLSSQRVFMLPQVQWEPVRTLPQDQDSMLLGIFPTPLASASDGGATRLLASSPTLAPSIPDLLVEGVLDAFAAGVETTFATTLPFGIQAIVRLRPAPSASLHKDALRRTEPVFITASVRGGTQLTALAEGGRLKPGDESPSFQGVTVQRKNGVDLVSGTPLNISVLGSTLDPAGSVESIFNSEFTSTAPRVPVTRFDFSGYGGSNFTDWQNPFGAFAQTTKVQFKVVVGRAFCEMIRVASMLYPWGIRVTRSVAIERTAGAGVIRKDSGWVASSPGLFDFRYKPNTGTPLQPSPYTVHPGAIRGLFRITRIRPTNGPVIEFPGSGTTVKMSPYYFDADVALDDGGVARANGLLGFLQLAPSGRPLDNSELAQLFALQGPIGGPIDYTLNVGSSGTRFRATRVEADGSLEGGAFRLVGVLRGGVIFPAVGSWATVRLPGPANVTAPREAVPVDGVRGTPLVRQQKMLDPIADVMQLSAAAGNYLFADSADLFAGLNPTMEYAFLESNPACAFLFRRPEIVLGTAEVSTVVAPSFADILARSTSKAVYPPLENAIDFPSAGYKLKVIPGGLELDPSLNISPSRPDLPLAQHGADQIRLNYRSATIRYSLDASGWNLNLTRLRSEADMLGISGFSANEYDIVGSALTRPVISRAQNFLFPSFEDTLDFIPGFTQHPNAGPIELAPSNLGHEIKIVLRAEFEKKFPPLVTIGCYVNSWVGWEIDPATGMTVPATGVEVGAELEVKIPIEPPWFILIGLEFAATEKQLVTTHALSTEIDVNAFVGFGAEIRIGPFGGDAYLAVGVVVIWDNGVWEVGGLVKLHAELDLEIVTASIDAELKGVVYCATPNRNCDYSGEVEVNVSICWVFHIDATYEASDTAVIGAC